MSGLKNYCFEIILDYTPHIAKEYASLKKELASKYQFDRPTYTKKKETFIKTIIEMAKKEITENKHLLFMLRGALVKTATTIASI